MPLTRTRTARVASLVATAALAAGAVATLSGPSSAAQRPSPQVSVHTASVAQRAAASRFWTPQRLEQAKTPPSMKVTPTQLREAARARPDGRLGKARGTAAGVPRAKGGPVTGIANGLVWPGYYSSYPVSMDGKIFFTFNGSGYVCSGTSVTAFYGGVQTSEVWTAGHCLANTTTTNPGTWATDVVFIPGYDAKGTTYAAREPFGRFPLTSQVVATSWLNSADRTVDFGAFKVGTSNTGRTLFSSVGAAGFMWNASTTQTFDAFGYPQAAPYDGTQMYHYQGATSGQVTVPGGSGGPQVGMVNPMTGGSSGGAWFVGWSLSNPATSGYINGHNDWKYDSGHVYSPYFNTLANTVRCFGGSGC